MPLINCAECGREISDKAAACVGCGAPIQPTHASVPPIVREAPNTQEVELLKTYPAMFSQSPLAFIVCVVLILFFGLGLVLLGIWWLRTRASCLTLTTKRVMLTTGLLAKNSNEVMLQHIRNIQVKQSFFQRLCDVGSIGISSAGQSGIEIEFHGLKRPNDTKALIDQYRGI